MMTIRVKLRAACLVATLLPLAAVAQPPRPLESSPTAGAVLEGRAAQYFVRFDGPVDHYGARLSITQGDRVVEVLHALLDSAPEVLFAEAPELPAGNYLLRWLAPGVPSGEVAEGSVPFTVRR
jgi:methionine-rich copper-binding protein CopC